MKCSVAMQAYRHAPYIRQAIEGVLMQDAPFPFELVIGEDGSTDGTREIVLEMRNRHPDRIRVLLGDRSNVITIRGRATGRRNLHAILEACRGEYIALCEGDDYWTSPAKLRLQVEAMDAHPEWSMCFHPAAIELEDGTQGGEIKIRVRRDVYTLEHYLAREIDIATAATLYRRSMMPQWPDWMWKVGFADVPMRVMLAANGPIGFVPGTMSVYRVHRGGIWSRGHHGADPEALEWQAETVVEAYTAFREYLGGRYDRPIAWRIAEASYDLAWCALLKGDAAAMRRALWRAVLERPAIPAGQRSFLAKAAFFACVPGALRLRRWLRGTGKRAV